MRLACCASSLLSSRSATGETSIFHAMTLHDFLKWNGVVLTLSNAFQGTLGEIQVFEILQVLQDSLAGVEALGAAGAAGKLLKTFLDGLRESDGQHDHLAIQV